MPGGAHSKRTGICSPVSETYTSWLAENKADTGVPRAVLRVCLLRGCKTQDCGKGDDSKKKLHVFLSWPKYMFFYNVVTFRLYEKILYLRVKENRPVVSKQLFGLNLI